MFFPSGRPILDRRALTVQSKLDKLVLISWCGDGVPEFKKGLYRKCTLGPRLQLAIRKLILPRHPIISGCYQFPQRCSSSPASQVRGMSLFVRYQIQDQTPDRYSKTSRRLISINGSRNLRGQSTRVVQLLLRELRLSSPLLASNHLKVSEGLRER
jgi:hypothetical protein